MASPELVREVHVITGASRGIGLDVARHLAGRGASLALCARGAEGLAEVAAELRAEHGVAVLAEVADVAEPEDRDRFAARVLAELGPPHGVIANAAVLGPVGPLAEVDLGRWEEAVRVNVVGTAGVAARFGAAMAGAGRGSIVVLAGGGVGGPRTSANLSAYVASKAAVVVLAESLARELAAAGVRVNAIAPGAIATSFTEEILAVGPERAGADLYEATIADQARKPSLAPFLDLLDFVLSDESSWLTGRLLSARWDPPDSLRARRHELTRSSLLQLRRVDGQLYGVLEGP